MKVYEFCQAHAGGGRFVLNGRECNRLFIEAETYEAAEAKIESLGCYEYDGPVYLDSGCSCCSTGRKRYAGYEVQTQDIEEYAQHLANEFGWTSPDARIYYADGTEKEIFVQGSDL